MPFALFSSLSSCPSNHPSFPSLFLVLLFPLNGIDRFALRQALPVSACCARAGAHAATPDINKKREHAREQEKVHGCQRGGTRYTHLSLPQSLLSDFAAARTSNSDEIAKSMERILVKTKIGDFRKTHGEERSAGGRPRDGGRNQRRAGCRVTLTHPVHHAGACREHMGLHCRVAAGVPCAVTSQKLVILQQATGACAHDLYQC